jgi:hypothetical protein
MSHNLWRVSRASSLGGLGYGFPIDFLISQIVTLEEITNKINSKKSDCVASWTKVEKGSNQIPCNMQSVDTWSGDGKGSLDMYWEHTIS